MEDEGWMTKGGARGSKMLVVALGVFIHLSDDTPSSQHPPPPPHLEPEPRSRLPLRQWHGTSTPGSKAVCRQYELKH